MPKKRPSRPEPPKPPRKMTEAEKAEFERKLKRFLESHGLHVN